MTGGDAIHDDVQFLTGSPQRGAILRALCEEPLRPTELGDRIDATRTTIQRVLSGFRERGWVRKRDGRYHATVTGRRIAERFDHLRREVETARDLRPVADHLDCLGEDLPDALLAESEVTVATEREPLAPLDRYTAWLQDCEDDRVRVAAPVLADTFERIAGQTLSPGTDLDLVVDESAVDDLESLCRGASAETRQSVSVFVHPGDVTAGLTLCGSRVCLGVHDETNDFRALLESTHPEVHEWGQRRFRELRTAASPIEEMVRTGE